jgi:pimeloyl-ACP methyl ester carboxylesterase
VSAGGGLHYGRYTTGGGSEWVMRIGPENGRPILLVPPLLEEMNRTRAFLASLMRGLASRGFGCWLPDLPGTGESERSLEECSWADWQAAVRDAFVHVRAASGRNPLGASIRGGALLDGGGSRVWRFAPATGASLARDLVRAAGLKPEELAGTHVDAAGYRISSELFSELRAIASLETESGRTVRLASDPGEADLKVEGAALWRRSEPGNDATLAEALAGDLAYWSERCAVF